MIQGKIFEVKKNIMAKSNATGNENIENTVEQEDQGAEKSFNLNEIWVGHPFSNRCSS